MVNLQMITIRISMAERNECENETYRMMETYTQRLVLDSHVPHTLDISLRASNRTDFRERNKRLILR